MRRIRAVGRWCRLLSFHSTLVLAATTACESENPPAAAPIRGSFGPVDQPIPPDGFLDHLSPEARLAEVNRLAEGTRLEELPANERVLIEAANENDRRRAHIRHQLGEMAKAQSRTRENAGPSPTTEPRERQ